MKIKKLVELKNRRALVTGATGHLGQVICATLAEMGADLILTDLSIPPLRKLANQLKKNFGANCLTISCNLESEEERKRLIRSVKTDSKSLSILINNAALVGTATLEGWCKPLAMQTLGTWRKAMEINLAAAFHLCQGLAPKLAKSPGASIINIGSIYGYKGPDWRLYQGTKMGNPAAYGISKAALSQLTRWLATVLAPNIRVNCIVVGGIQRSQPLKFQARYKARVPLKRMACEGDFRGTVAYLASDLSTYVTGIDLPVDGGYMLV